MTGCRVVKMRHLFLCDAFLDPYKAFPWLLEMPVIPL